MVAMSAYLACRSATLAVWMAGVRSPQASAITMGRKPCCMASVALARTQPEVDTPAITAVSILAAVNVAASDVPKKAEAYCLTMTTSSGRGSRPATNSPRSPGTSSASRRNAPTLWTNSPPSLAPGRYLTRVCSTGRPAARAAASNWPQPTTAAPEPRSKGEPGVK